MSTETVLLRLPEVEAITGLKKSALYNRIKQGDFPVPVKLGPRAVAWKSDEVREWIGTRPRAIDAEEVGACWE